MQFDPIFMCVVFGVIVWEIMLYIFCIYTAQLCTKSISEITPYFTPVFRNKPTGIVGIEICMDSWEFNPISGNCPSWKTAVKKSVRKLTPYFGIGCPK